MKLSLFLTALAGIAFQAAPARASTVYAFTRLTPSGAVTESQSAGINNNGVVASKSGDQVFTFDGTNYTYYSNLDWVNSSFISDVAGVDNAGNIAFNYFDSGFIYSTSGNTVTGNYIQGAGNGLISSISSSGQQLAGTVDNNGFLGSMILGYVTDASTTTTTFYPGWGISGVNNSGDWVAAVQGAFALGHGLTNIYVQVPGSASTVRYGLNDLGQVVGTYDPGDGLQHGFLWTNGTTSTVDYPGATSVTLDGINSQGVILGGATDANGSFLFLATPQSAAAAPEPGTTMLLGTGLGLVGLARLLRRKQA